MNSPVGDAGNLAALRTLSRLWCDTLRRSRTAVGVIFFTNGFVFASWVPHIPLVKDRHGLGDATLGAVLFAFAAGSMIALPLAGRLVTAFGSRRVTGTAALGFCLTLPLPMVSVNVTTLAMALMLFGVLNATLDVAMNAQAVEIEKRHGRAIMSSFHGLFSLGGLLGAGAAGISLLANMAATHHVLLVCVVFCLLVVLVVPGLIGGVEGQRESTPIFARPTGPFLFLGMLAFLGLMVEGAMADWSAVYLRDSLGTTPALAAVGFAAFSLAMTIGRFAGDRLVRRAGPERVLRLSGWVAALGITFAVCVQHPVAAVLGFGMVGLGASNIIPILFSAAGRVPGVSPAHGLAAVATMGYFGFLAGPPLIGGIAHLSTMSVALGLLAFLCMLIALRASILSK